jgi:hypothetical protein
MRQCAMRKQPKAPDQVRGIRVGDTVMTPLGRIAVVTKIRIDGYLDAKYVHVGSPVLADVILNADTVKRA